jgi:hypothetical protein
VFDSLAVLVVWAIWLHRNDRVFGRRVLSDDRMVALVFAQAEEWCRARLVVRSSLFGEYPHWCFGVVPALGGLVPSHCCMVRSFSILIQNVYDTILKKEMYTIFPLTCMHM